jgi:hypothetical protein
MHNVELYEAAKSLADSLGYQIREENLGGIGGGACEVAGRKCIFVDIATSSVEQLDQLVLAISQDPAIHTADLPPSIQQLFSMQRAA